MQCGKCQGPITKDTRFCGRCGEALPAARSATASGEHVAVPFSSNDLDALTELNSKKQRLTDELESMITSTNEGKTRDSEQHRYQELRTEWGRVRQQITDKMEVFSPRSDEDRRERMSKRMEQAIDAPARDTDERRGRGGDRRDPFPENL